MLLHVRIAISCESGSFWVQDPSCPYLDMFDLQIGNMLIIWLWAILSHNCMQRDFNMLMPFDFHCCIFVIACTMLSNCTYLWKVIRWQFCWCVIKYLNFVQTFLSFFFPPYVGEVLFGLLNFIDWNIGCCWYSSFLWYLIFANLMSTVFLLQLNAEKSPFQRTFVNQVLFIALMRNPITFWIPYCIVWMTGFWEEINRENRDWWEIFHLFCPDTVWKTTEISFYVWGPAKRSLLQWKDFCTERRKSVCFPHIIPY